MKCEGCGKSLLGEETFCPSCGTRVGSSTGATMAGETQNVARQAGLTLSSIAGEESGFGVQASSSHVKIFFGVLAVLIIVIVAVYLSRRTPTSESLIQMYQRASVTPDVDDKSKYWKATFGAVQITLTSMSCNVSGNGIIFPTPLFSVIQDKRTGRDQYSCWHIKEDQVRVFGNRGFAESFPIDQFEFDLGLSGRSKP
jgi:hypothetical protein